MPGEALDAPRSVIASIAIRGTARYPFIRVDFMADPAGQGRCERVRTMLLLIDNYDSFTYNLVHLIGGLGKKITVFRNDALSAADAIAHRPDAIVLSPGPRTPDDAGICLDLVAAAATTRTPVFGVCLGMQSIAQGFGGQITRARRLMHGKTSTISHHRDGLFVGLPETFQATRYHSLSAVRQSLPNVLNVTATSNDDQEIMALAHHELPIAGVQFHPESIASEHGAAIFTNFLTWSHSRKSAS